MKKFLVALAISIPLFANGAWIDAKGNPIPDTPSMRSSGDFGVQLALTANEKEFRSTWNATTGTPQLTTASAAKVGSSISGVLIFSGCDGGTTNACNVSVEFLLQAPDGSISPAGKGPLWTSAPPKSRILMLSNASVTIGFDSGDALGAYNLIAVVTDNISKRTLRLTSQFTLAK